MSKTADFLFHSVLACFACSCLKCLFIVCEMPLFTLCVFILTVALCYWLEKLMMECVCLLIGVGKYSDCHLSSHSMGTFDKKNKIN